MDLGIDGSFGAPTNAAVNGFQVAYGLSADGVAGPPTFSKIYALQDADCSPAHFDFSEVDHGCGVTGYGGGSVDAATVKENLKRVIGRGAAAPGLGDTPLQVTSGFRASPATRRSAAAAPASTPTGRRWT